MVLESERQQGQYSMSNNDDDKTIRKSFLINCVRSNIHIREVGKKSGGDTQNQIFQNINSSVKHPSLSKKSKKPHFPLFMRCGLMWVHKCVYNIMS